jgi:flagellar basal body-associated protein FliL
MGMSHKSSVLTYIFIIIIAIIIIVGFVLYFIWKIKKRIQRGAKLAASEETKGGNTTVGAKA